MSEKIMYVVDREEEEEEEDTIHTNRNYNNCTPSQFVVEIGGWIWNNRK